MNELTELEREILSSIDFPTAQQMRATPRKDAEMHLKREARRLRDKLLSARDKTGGPKELVLVRGIPPEPVIRHVVDLGYPVKINRVNGRIVKLTISWA